VGSAALLQASKAFSLPLRKRELRVLCFVGGMAVERGIHECRLCASKNGFHVQGWFMGDAGPYEARQAGEMILVVRSLCFL